MAQVELLLSPLAAHVRTARLVGVAAARRAGLDDELLDELRLALGEACSRAVRLHALHAPDMGVRIVVQDDPTGLVVTVTDAGPAVGGEPAEISVSSFSEGVGALEDGSEVDPSVALAVLHGLVDDLDVQSADGGRGTTVTMRWPLPPRAP